MEVDGPLSMSPSEVAKGVPTVEGSDGVEMELSAVDQVEKMPDDRGVAVVAAGDEAVVFLP
jgi:hypothetical protein